MLMSAPVEYSLVIQMPTALTLLVVSCAIASLDMLGMASLVKVCTETKYFSFLLIILTDSLTLAHHLPEHLHLCPLLSSPDIDECEDPGNNPICHEHANCTDSEGSYECTCNTGFSGDGFNCSGLNLCLKCTWYL